MKFQNILILVLVALAAFADQAFGLGTPNLDGLVTTSMAGGSIAAVGSSARTIVTNRHSLTIYNRLRKQFPQSQHTIQDYTIKIHQKLVSTKNSYQFILNDSNSTLTADRALVQADSFVPTHVRLTLKKVKVVGGVPYFNNAIPYTYPDKIVFGGAAAGTAGLTEADNLESIFAATLSMFQDNTEIQYAIDTADMRTVPQIQKAVDALAESVQDKGWLMLHKAPFLKGVNRLRADLVMSDADVTNINPSTTDVNYVIIEFKGFLLRGASEAVTHGQMGNGYGY